MKNQFNHESIHPVKPNRSIHSRNMKLAQTPNKGALNISSALYVFAKKPAFGIKLSLAIATACGVLTGPGLITSPGINQLAIGMPTAYAATTQDPAEAGQFTVDTVPAQFDTLSLDTKKDRQTLSERRAARSDIEKKVIDALTGSGSLSASDQSAVAGWIGKVLMAEMTQTNPDVLTVLGEMRVDLFRKIVTPTSNEANRNFLINSVIRPRAVEIVTGNYHPAARVNAAQILGLLDTQEGVSGTQAPKPSIAALGELIGIVDDAKSPDFLVAACLSGIQRHAEIDGQVRDRMAPAARTAVINSMLNLLTKHTAELKETQVGYVLSRRAVQTLGALKIPANDAQATAVKAAIAVIAKNASAGKWLRLDAMMALSTLPLDDAKSFVTELGQLVALVTLQERQSMVVAQTQVQIEKEVNDKIGAAEMKRTTKGNGPKNGPMGAGGGAGGESMALGRGEGAGMGAGIGIDSFDESGLLPFHLHHVRTNVKLISTAARIILGTQPKASTGLKFVNSVKSDADLMTLINDLDKQLVELQKATDIGLVEEKELTENERLIMDPAKLAMLDQTTTVRVLYGLGSTVESLTGLVGEVKLPEDDAAPEAAPEKAAEVSTIDGAKTDQ